MRHQATGIGQYGFQLLKPFPDPRPVHLTEHYLFLLDSSVLRSSSVSRASISSSSIALAVWPNTLSAHLALVEAGTFASSMSFKSVGDTFSNLNPFTPSLSSPGEPAGTFYGALKFNQGLRYAATTASKTFGTTHLVYPYKSSVFRGLITDSQKVGKVSMLSSLVLAGMRAGHCQ